jgi:hypothetical protein
MIAALCIALAVTALHEGAKPHEGHEPWSCTTHVRELRAPSCLRDEPSFRDEPFMTQDAISLRTIDKGAQSNVDAAKQAVARTQTEWTALWKSHDYDRPAPKVDFAKETVVAVFMGSRPTAGFAIEIVGAALRDGALVVTYRETLPPSGALTAQIITSPYHMAAVPKHAGAVKFEKAPQ